MRGLLAIAACGALAVAVAAQVPATINATDADFAKIYNNSMAIDATSAMVDAADNLSGSAGTPPRFDRTVTPAARRSAELDAIEAKLRARPDATLGDVIGAALRKFRGRAPQYVFDRLGYPDRKMLVGGATVYSWTNADSDYGGGAISCTIKVVARAAKVVDTDAYGNQGACVRFAQRLDPTFRWPY